MSIFIAHDFIVFNVQCDKEIRKTFLQRKMNRQKTHGKMKYAVYNE